MVVKLIRELMGTTYTDALSVVARDRYISKIQCILGLVGEYKEHCLAALDPYRLPDAVWVDDTSKIMASSGLFVAIAFQKFK